MIREKKTIKELKDLTLLDRFLFAEAIEDPETMELILEIILGKEVILKHLPQTEKEQRAFHWSKHVRLIAPFDLFGRGLYRYTFSMRCDECPEIGLEDGATRIFLNTRGTDPTGVSEEMGVKFMNLWEEKLLERQDAFEEGRETAAREIAAKLKKAGIPAKTIADNTGLTVEEIEEL